LQRADGRECGRRPPAGESGGSRPPLHAYLPLIAMRLTFCCAAGDFGRVTVRTPLLKEAATFAEETLLVFRFALLLAADRQHAVCKLDVDVLLFETGKLGDDLDFLVALVEFDVRPAHCGRGAERTEIKAAEGVVEQPVHLTMKRKQRVAGFAALNGHVA
jgi:hypothetical protein